MGKKTKKTRRLRNQEFLKKRCVYQISKINELAGTLEVITKQLKLVEDENLSSLTDLIHSQIENRCHRCLRLMNELFVEVQGASK